MTPIEHNTPNVPRSVNGASSVKYIGIVLVVNPDANPTNNLPIISISTEFAARQVIKNSAPMRNKTPHDNTDLFLKPKYV